jgi:hypothetical protein
MVDKKKRKRQREKERVRYKLHPSRHTSNGYTLKGIS